MGRDKTKAGKYQISSKIAEGGMGCVYKALHPTLERDVILKELTMKSDTSYIERFKREANIMIDFRNENIVQVYDHFQENNNFYIVMEYIDGTALDLLIQKNKKIDSEAAMLIFREICKGLKYAHDKKVIHRDIKPANILISKNGQVKLTDFGIASSEKEKTESDLTVVGDALGTPAYMSPEQIENVKNADARSDIYSMGVMLYEMVTGQKPFPAKFTPESLTMICKGKYTDPKFMDPEIHPTVQKLIRKMMHCKPSKRFKELKPVITELNKALGDFETEDQIHSAIQDYIDDKPMIIKDIPNKKMRHFSFKFLKPVAIFLCAALILTAAFYFIQLKGVLYETIFSNDYGALSIKVKFHPDLTEPWQRSVKAILFKKDTKNDYKKMKEIEISFHEEQNPTNKSYSAFSKKIYLNESDYRITIYTPFHQYYEDFYLDSRKAQKNNPETKEAKSIQIEVSSVEKLPIELKYRVRNIDNKANITQDTELSVYFVKEKTWRKWNDLIAHKDFKEDFTTGKEYLFQFKKQGYYDHTIAVYPKKHEVSLNLEIALIPVPGMLYLSFNQDGMDVLLNHSKHYFTGGIERKYKELDSSTTKTQKILLAPGKYTLTVKKSDSITQDLQFEINSYQATRIKADFISSQNRLEIKQD